MNTFRGKYGYYPGDIRDPDASNFGFAPRGAYAGQGDGNGLIEGVMANCSGCNAGAWQTAGETALFWQDLAAANLIEGSFSAASSTTPPGTVPSGVAINSWLPQATIGNGNYVYAWSVSSGGTSIDFPGTVGKNYFGISAVTVLQNNATGTSLPGLSVAQAYPMDAKVDDGQPQGGHVLAMFDCADSAIGNSSQPYWANSVCSAPCCSGAISPSPTTCFDTGGVGSNPRVYSTTTNNDAGVNCALSFQFQ